MNFNNLNNIENDEANIRKVYQTSIQDCCLQLQQSIDSSYKIIDDFLDQIIYDTEKQFNQRFQLSYGFQQNSSLPCFFDGNSLSDQVTSLTKMSMKNHLKKQEECLNQEIQQQIKQKQSQKQQLIHQSSPELILNPFNYQLIQENSIKVMEQFHAIAINKIFQLQQLDVVKQSKYLNSNKKY